MRCLLWSNYIYISNGDVLLQNDPSDTKHAGEGSELLRYFDVVYLKTGARGGAVG